MVKKNNVLFCIEYAGEEHPCVYWGTRVPTKDEATKYIMEIGHGDFLTDYPEGITDVFPIVNFEQAETLWDLNKEYPHFISSSCLPPEINGWVCTDPDGSQYQKALSNTLFEMVQAFEMPDDSYVVAKSYIDLDDYTNDEINSYVDAYYASIDELKSEYGESSNGIIAECIFESLQPIDYAYRFPAKLEIEAMSIIHGIITK